MLYFKQGKQISKTTFYKFVKEWKPFYTEGVNRFGEKYKNIQID